jgi:hypothetical protein
VTVSAATVRRTTEKAGAVYESVQTTAVDRIVQELPPAPAGPREQVLSVDGAMACSDRWAEAWPRMAGHVRQQIQQERRQCQLASRAHGVSASICSAVIWRVCYLWTLIKCVAHQEAS